MAWSEEQVQLPWLEYIENDILVNEKAFSRAPDHRNAPKEK